ncbi:MAG: TetR/AcrR family transcriptional regulator [Gammaproteobacteria bacterium]|nr:TetR/AcrR family transcriptional regulator [Gammaproteobacteria bacterium]
MEKRADLSDKILDSALELAETRHWESLRLYDVADIMGISLSQIHCHFREKDELIDAWFDRADTAMLEDANSPEFQALSSQTRIHRAIMTWLGALAAHQRITRQMIVTKLEFGHIHIQIPALMRISRTVQWIREMAQRDATFFRRAIEETVLTSIYLMVFTKWMNDNSPQFRETHELLERLLHGAASLSHLSCCEKKPYEQDKAAMQKTQDHPSAST